MTIFVTLLQIGAGLFVCYLFTLLGWFLFHVLRGAIQR
jgi:hypothetical protein